jgi:RNA polymerase sigma-70 factor (ECF subfamily)
LTVWDEKLVSQMKLGEQSAFEHCYRCLSPKVYTAIHQICRNQAIAEDILQDTFIDAFAKLTSYQPSSSFLSWLKRIAFNKTINVINRNKKSQPLAEEMLESDDFLDSPEIQLGNRQMLTTLLKAVSENERLILWLYIVEQYTHNEIALLVDQTPSYSKSIVSRSLKKLRNYSEEKSYVYR